MTAPTNPTAAPTKRLGPNDLQPCPSEACRRHHLAHGWIHDCQINIPNERRFQGARRWDVAA
jgi:hypothetical protein